MLTVYALSAADVSTDELPTFDLVYKQGDKVISLYIVYYPIDYMGESADYAQARLINMASERVGLPFSD